MAIAYTEHDGRSWRCDGCGSHGRIVNAANGHQRAAETVALHIEDCTPEAKLAPRQAVAHALISLAPIAPASRIWGRLEGATAEQAAEGNAWAADPDDIAELVLTVVTDLMRAEVGPSDCGCGGCDTCCQHALIDWLDPR